MGKKKNKLNCVTERLVKTEHSLDLFLHDQIAAMINEAAVDDWFSCRHLHDDHHQPPWQDPVVNQEVYAYGSTSNSIVPVAPHHQGAMFYNIGM